MRTITDVRAKHVRLASGMSGGGNPDRALHHEHD